MIFELGAESQPRCSGAKLNLRDKSLGEVKKNSFIVLPGKWGHSGLLPSKLCIPAQVDLVGSVMAMWKGGVADKGLGVCRACTPLIWPQVVS